jgi:hypothetical protein
MIEAILIPVTCLAITGIINNYINNNQLKARKKEFAKRTAYINRINNDINVLKKKS